MKPADSDSWFWTPERMTRLFETLKELAEQDTEGWYFDHQGLTYRLKDYLYDKGETDLINGEVGNALQILVGFSVLALGKPGRKTPGTYRRRFYPEKMPDPFTWSHIEQYRGYRATRL